MTIDNRDRFKNSQHAKDWGKLAASDMWVEATNTALLTMVGQQQPDTAAANHYRLEGARHVIGILTNLTTERKEPVREDHNLKTNV